MSKCSGNPNKTYSKVNIHNRRQFLIPYILYFIVCTLYIAWIQETSFKQRRKNPLELDPYVVTLVPRYISHSTLFAIACFVKFAFKLTCLQKFYLFFLEKKVGGLKECLLHTSKRPLFLVFLKKINWFYEEKEAAYRFKLWTKFLNFWSESYLRIPHNLENARRVVE